MTMKVLVTGVTGFIGSHCAVELLQQGYDVVGIDNYDNSYDVNDEILALSDRSLSRGTYSFHKVDLMNKNAVEEIFREHSVDIVVHLAGKKAVSESITNPIMYYQTNILTSCNVFAAALRYNVDKIIFSSSAPSARHIPPTQMDDLISGHPLHPRPPEHFLSTHKTASLTPFFR